MNQKTYTLKGAKISENQRDNDTEYVISGTLAEVAAAVEYLFDQYPAPGYGTWVRENYGFAAVVERMNCCD